MSARVDGQGTLHRLGGRAGAANVFTADSLEDRKATADTLTSLAEDVADVANRHVVDFLDFEDLAADGAGGELVLTHGYGGRVRWYVVDWTSTLGGVPPVLEKSSRTTEDVLVLTSNEAGTVSIRVEKV